METGNESVVAQYLSFFVAGEEYGIEILRVREIIEWGTVTRVPGAPASIRGVINLRGAVVPVVDLAVKLGLPASAVSRRSCVVVLEIELDGKRTVMGIMADAVSQLLELSAKDIEPPPQFGTRMQVEYLRGMGKAGDKFALLLDVDRVLTSGEILAAASLQVPGAEPDSASTKEPAG